MSSDTSGKERLTNHLNLRYILFIALVMMSTTIDGKNSFSTPKEHTPTMRTCKGELGCSRDNAQATAVTTVTAERETTWELAGWPAPQIMATDLQRPTHQERREENTELKALRHALKVTANRRERDRQKRTPHVPTISF